MSSKAPLSAASRNAMIPSMGRLDLTGQFWRPEDEADSQAQHERWAGRLVEDPARGVRVTASAPDRHDLLMETFSPIVWGRTVDQLVTMTDVRVDVAGRLPGGAELTLTPQRTFVGRRAFEPDESIALKRLVVRMEGLDEWAAQSGFGRTWLPSLDRFTLGFERPDPIPLAEVDGICIDLNFWVSTQPRGDPPVAWNIEQESVIRFQSDEPVPYDVLEPLAQHTRNFVTFAARHALDVLFTRGYLDPIDGRSYPEDYLDELEIVSRCFPPRDPSDDPPTNRDSFMFTAADSGDPADGRLARWLARTHEDDLGPVLDLYLSTMYQPRAFVEYQFLALAQALESFHSRRFQTRVLSRADHRERVRAVLRALAHEEELCNWARQRLRGANRKTYHDAIIELLASLPPGVAELFTDSEHFARKVVATRNYHTHWNRALRAEAVTDSHALGRFSRALRCVLEALLLLEIGFTADETDALLARNRDFRRDLTRGLAAAGLPTH